MSRGNAVPVSPGNAVPDGLLDLVVPVYVHPDEAPHRWQRLASMADRVRIAVVNVHDGPGSGRDPAYLCAVHALRLSGIRVAGYVDTGYGRRTVTEVASDVAAYRRWYDLDAVFLDQVSSGLAELDHYADCVLGAVEMPAHLEITDLHVRPRHVP